MARNWTQKDLAERSNSTLRVVQRIEGKNGQVRFDTLFRVLLTVNPKAARRLSESISFEGGDFEENEIDALKLEHSVHQRRRVRPSRNTH